MARFDVQANTLDRLGTRAVFPLLPSSASPPPIRQLNPTIWFEGEPHVLHPEWITFLPRAELNHPIANLSEHWDEIIRALDMLLIGF